MSKEFRRKIIYSGRVQGVGFRWNVVRLVKDFKITGFVRNLDNGTVETLLEGGFDENRQELLVGLYRADSLEKLPLVDDRGESAGDTWLLQP